MERKDVGEDVLAVDVNEVAELVFGLGFEPQGEVV